ncbi:MAG: SGNH/GDSL hydrolase family protein [Lachnospiraceae bacterium]|nr:SGNH/GDSL hydrolase family protein [Lachnospiraceae bacterium]
MKRQRSVWFASVLTIILIIVLVFIIYVYLQVRPDLKRLAGETYDTVFMSMYPIDNYYEEDYKTYRGMTTVKCEYEIPNTKMMQLYMRQINNSSNAVTTIYLGVDPQKTNNADIAQMIQENPTIMYEIVLFHPQIQYWTSMNETECGKVIDKYQKFYESVYTLPNARVYFFGNEEWLVCNPANYEAENLTNISVSLRLMCVSDYKHKYLLQPEKVQDCMDDMRQLISTYRDEPIVYADGSGYDIVFLGDSIFGNYTDSMSIPGVVNGLTNANTYNCSIGGQCATTVWGRFLSANVVADALITGDLSALPKEHHIYEDCYNFVNRDGNRKVMFIINLGLNDYFEGCALCGDDEKSFEGAMRSIIQKIREAYPDAEIVICTPNFTIQCDYGRQIMGENGGVLKDYADIINKVAEEMDIDVIDNYNELPISEENWNELLSDGCHFNEEGRFLFGSKIAQKIQ